MKKMRNLLLLLCLGSAAALAQQSIQWGDEGKKSPAGATPATKSAAPAQSGTRPPPPPPASGQTSKPGAPPPPPPSVPVAYDPMTMTTGVDHRGIRIHSQLQGVTLNKGGNSLDIYLANGSAIVVFFSGSSGTGQLPRGAYTLGIDIETSGAPPTGSISIVQGGAVNGPRLQTCALVRGPQRCSGWANSGDLGIMVARVEYSGSGSLPKLKKIVVEVP